MNNRQISTLARNTFERSAIIKDLNDALRREGKGGRLMMTAGISSLPSATQAMVLDAVARFDAFNSANDPFEEHDFGIVRVGDTTACFKIDYYDSTLTMHSPDPAVAAVTTRVMTIMLGCEF